MINTITLQKDTQRFQLCDLNKIDFIPGLNIITGANTSGKSSLLSIVKEFNYYRDDVPESSSEKDMNQVFKDNPVDLEKFGCKAVKGKVSKVVEYELGELNAWTRFINKHQDFNATQLSQLKSEGIKFAKDLIILSDEPENNLSVMMQFKLADWFHNLVLRAEEKVQVIIATNSIPFILLKDKPRVNLIELNNGWSETIIQKLKERLG